MSYYDGLAPSAGHVYVGARATQQDSRPRASYQLPELAALVARAPSAETRKREELPTAEAVMVYEQSPLGGDRFWPDGARPYPAQQKKRRRDECEDDDVESTLRRPLASNIPNPMLSTCANCNREMSLVEMHTGSIRWSTFVCHTCGTGIHAIGALLAFAFADEKAGDDLLTLKGEQVERMMELVQLWISKRRNSSLQPKAMRLLQKLSTASGVLPRDVFIHGVDIGDDRDPIARGGFADIFRGVYGKLKVAVKRLHVMQEDKATIHRVVCKEALLWRQLDHPYILPFIGVDAETFASRGMLCLVSPWMEQGTIKQYIMSPSYIVNRDRCRLLYETAQGILYLHTRGIVHGDLNWVNIFVNEDGSAQVADFGISIVSETGSGGTTATHTGKGTVAWMAPERISGTAPRLAPPMDVYSFGMLCLSVYTKARPFPGLNDYQIVLHVYQGLRPRRPSTDMIPDGVWTLMDRCWTRDPLARPSMTEIVHLFELIMTPFLSPSQQHPQLFDFSQLRYNYLNMLQSNSANVPQEIPVDQQDAIWVLTDTPQAAPGPITSHLPQTSQFLVSPTQSPWDDVPPTPELGSDSPQFLVSPLESPWDYFLPTPELGPGGDFTPDIFPIDWIPVLEL